MKYLKHFESKSDDQFHIDQIRDIFQDIIDEYVIDAHTVLDRQFVIDPGFYYAIANKGRTIRFVISVNFHDSEELNDQNILLYEKFKSLRVDIKLVNKRLKSMGYEFKELIIDDYPHSNNLIIYDFKI